MKKIKFLLVSLISIFAFNISVFAASGNLKVSSTSVYVGDSFKVTVNISSAAAWNIHVSASGPVSGCLINQADATADAMDTNKTFSATCTATGTGTITISLSGDVTSASDGNAVNVSGSKSVTVSAKPTKPTPSNPKPQQPQNNLSKNNNIKELTVEGYELTKVDNNNYTLTVSNNVSSINIKAIAEDSKSKVTGAGSHDINVGENNIEVIVTAENGSKNKINVKITRKDGYYLEDLDSLLKNNNDDINITIGSDTKIAAQDLEAIKNSNKTVKFNYYDDNKNLIYSWIIDGSKIKDTNDLLTTISNNPDNKKDILKLSNYADGLFIELKQSNNLPAGTKIKLFVGDKYEDNDLVNVYAYVKNNNKLELLKNKIKVDNGYIEIDDIDTTEYLITMSNIPNSDNVVIATDKSPLVLPIILGIICLLLIGIIIVLIIKNKKNNKDNKTDDSYNTMSNQYESKINEVNTINTINSNQSNDDNHI